MKGLQTVLLSTLTIFDLPLSFDGYTLSFWKIFLWMLVAAAVLKVLFDWFNGGL